MGSIQAADFSADLRFHKMFKSPKFVVNRDLNHLSLLRKTIVLQLNSQRWDKSSHLTAKDLIFIGRKKVNLDVR